MTLLEFNEQLELRLKPLSRAEREELISYYQELIQDSIEDGLSEEEAITRLGDIDTLVDDYVTQHKAQQKNVLPYILIMLGSPLWLAIAACGLAIVMGGLMLLVALFITVWALIFTACVLALSCLIIAVAGIFGSIMVLIHYGWIPALFQLSVGVFSLGVYFLIFPYVVKLVRFVGTWSFNFTKKIFRSINNKWKGAQLWFKKTFVKSHSLV